ncbi:MAG: GNAT family N-acetyltransferase [Verrucomicrobiaceae bacterium]|nr:GNAT family N-acetyltransferase [Verrucomicrobiaceae bacterium]
MLAHDPFLSGLLGKPAYHASAPDISGDVLRDGVPSFVDAKVKTADVRACSVLEASGFRLIDTNVQLDAPTSTIAALPAAREPGPAIRFAAPNDRAGVEEVAGSCFVYSRFHLDPQVEPARAHEVKRRWAGNYFSGNRGRWMIVAEHDGAVAAFLQLLAKDDAIIIDLIGVAAAHQRRGLGRAMIRHAALECGPAARMIVGTQIANAPSLRAYAALGFRVCSSSYVFHYHGPVNHCA